MHYRLHKTLIIVISVVAVLFAACTPSPTATPTPTTEPVAPTETVAPPTDTPEPTATEEPTATPEPTEAPVVQPIALYAAGTDGTEALRLYDLSETGESQYLDQLVYSGATVSPFGSWIATPASAQSASGVMIQDLKTPTLWVVGAFTEFDVFGMSFDSVGSRLAVLEVSEAGIEEPGWAILSVRVDDGTFTRFAGGDWMQAQEQEEVMLPGYPIGWTASGQELLLNTFLPYTDAGTQGVVAIEIPPMAEEALIDDLPSRQILAAEEYRSRPRFSPDATRLLYLARDEEYTPDNYEPVAFDLAVNQLWSLDVTTEEAEPVQWLSVEDGSALASTAAWSPDGTQVLYAQGTYAGDVWDSLTLKIHDGNEVVQEIGDVDLGDGASLTGLHWCRPELALVTTVDNQGAPTLTLMNLTDGSGTVVTDENAINVLGCVGVSAAP